MDLWKEDFFVVQSYSHQHILRRHLTKLRRDCTLLLYVPSQQVLIVRILFLEVLNFLIFFLDFIKKNHLIGGGGDLEECKILKA